MDTISSGRQLILRMLIYKYNAKPINNELVLCFKC